MSKQKKLVSLVAVAILLFGTLFFGFKFVSQFLNNDSQVEDSTLVVSQPGIIEIGEKYKKVVVQVGGVELTNGLTDEIVVEASVGDGEVTLSDVSSKKMTLLGGGVNSIYISGGSSIQSVSIKRVDGNIRVVVTDTSNVSTMTVYDGSQDVVLEGQVGSVSIEAANININVNGSNMDSISVSGANTTVTVDENSNLNSATLTSTAEQSKYIFKGTVGSIQVDSNKSTIEVYGEVKDVTINDASENTTILVDKSGSIASMTSIASITTSGEGTIDEVTTDSKAKVSGTATVTVFNLPVNPVTPSKPSTTPTTKPASTGSTVSTSSSEGTSSSSSASSTSGSTSSTTTVNYTVAFNTNGGSSVSSLSLSNGSKIASSPTTSKTGYTFVGWYKEAGFVNIWSFANDVVNANTTLYAKWTQNSIAISSMADIVGTPQVGETLTIGDVLPNGATYSYQWKISSNGTDYSNISGATNNSYVVQSSDAEKFIKLFISGTGIYTGNLTSSAIQVEAIVIPDPVVEVFFKSTLGLPTGELSVKVDNNFINQFDLYFDGVFAGSTDVGVMVVVPGVVSDLSRVQINFDSALHSDTNGELSIRS